MTQTKTNTIAKMNEKDTHMKAIVYHTYGSPDVLKLEDVQKPVPQDDEVLVQVHAASVNAGDWFFIARETVPDAPHGLWASQTKKHDTRI